MQQSFRLVLFGISVFAALALAGPPAAAQTASLVYDFGSRAPFAPPPVATPAGLFDSLSLGERLFFSSSRSLWVTDGKPNGTRSLNDLCRGACPAGKWVGSLGSLAFFAACDPSGPLWRSDGTAQGTFALTPPGWSVVVAPDPRFDPVLRGGTASLGGRFYFLACQGSGSSCGLWRSDGTVAGTRPAAAGFGGGALLAAGGRLFGLDAGSVVVGDGTTASRIASLDGSVRLAQAGDHKVFLVANHDTKVDSLWVSDGTAAGTRFLRSFGQYPYTEGIRWLKVVGDRAYVVATDGRTELWRSDGTRAGTEQITSFRGDDPFFASTPEQMAEIGGRAVFLASAPFLTGIWATTSGKTAPTLLTTLCSGDCTVISHRLVQVGNRVVFRTETGMMASDGTPSGTVSLPCRGECISEALPFSGAALYVTDPFQLWQTDGTPQGTRRVADLSDDAAVAGSTLDRFAAPLGRRIAVAVPGLASPGLWVTDGTKEGSFPLLAANEGPSADLENLFPVGDRLLFSDCTTPASGDLWASAGTAETTALVVHDGSQTGCPTLLPAGGVPLGSATFFYRGSALWRTDGTAAGTRKLLDLSGSSTQGFSSFPVAFGDRAVFAVSDQNGNARLWESDGTPDGTRARFDFPAAVRRPYNFRSAGGTLFFLAGQDIDSRVALWASDGTAAGTRVLTGLVDGNALGQVWVAPLGGRVYFNFRTTSSQTSSLWRTDGTAAGTTRVTTSDGNGIVAEIPVALGDALYFFGSPDTLVPGQRRLWRFDGDAADAGPLVPLRPCLQTPPSDLTAAGSHLFFTADDDSNRCELWQSDGTAAGTVRVRTSPPLLFPPDHLAAAGGRLFFVAEDGVHGRELWTSDGTEAGTRMVQDLKPGELPSNPEQLTAAGNRLYFTADDGTTGRELWSLPLSGPACQPSSTVLCLADGRFQLQVTWRDFAGHTGAGQAVPLSADTGTFWFFAPENVELIVKVLDARAVNQSFWVFYGALSSVEYTLSVTDTQTGFTRRYLNPGGQLASFADTSAFGPLGAYSARDVRVPAPPVSPPATPARSAAASCVAGPDHLCLAGGRFAVTAAWKDFSGNAGTGTAVALSGDTGYFWFFAPENVEVVLKVLDGRGLNGKFWVFYGALSNVEYTLTVTDTQTGAVKTYRNPSGQLASVADTGAF